MKKLAAAFAALGSLALSFPASAFDVDPGDYTALKPGTNLFLAYYQYAERNKLYSHGNQVAGDYKLQSNIGILRYVHFTEIAGYTIDPQILLPFGKLTPAGDSFAPVGSNSGVGDPVLAATLWLVNKPNERTYFGVTPFLFVPIGNYDKDKVLNLGENRWKLVLQAGLIAPLAEKWTVDLLGDTTFHGTNDNYRPNGNGPDRKLEQDPSYQFQAHLRHHVSDALTLGVSYSYIAGGKQKVDGASQDNRIKTDYFRLTGSYFVTPKTQVLASIGKDIGVENGFKESGRVNLRLLTVF
jgi:hypothetical protein